MIDLEFVERLIRSIDQSSIDTVEIERGGTRIRVSKTPSSPVGASAAVGVQATNPGHVVQNHSISSPPAAPAEPAPAAESPQEKGAENWVEVPSPMVGTFYRAPSPGAEPFTEVGKRISEGDTLCIIEAMKLMNELEAELSGVVREICVENGEPVEYGQVLFRVEPA